jgi:hypothetical protein
MSPSDARAILEIVCRAAGFSPRGFAARDHARSPRRAEHTNGIRSRAFPVSVFRAAGFSPRGFLQSDVLRTAVDPARENENRSKAARPYGRRRAARRSAVLVLVIFFIALAGLLALTAMGSTVQLVRTGRNEHATILVQQLIYSGRAWARIHQNAYANSPVELDATDLLPPEYSGSVSISVKRGAPATVVITAQIQMPDRQLQRTAMFSM